MPLTIDQYFAHVGAYTFILAMLLTFALRYCIDDEKVRQAKSPSALFRLGAPPRSMLTSVGLKIWWIRLVAIIVVAVSLFCASVMEKKEPIQPLETMPHSVRPEGSPSPAACLI